MTHPAQPDGTPAEREPSGQFAPTGTTRIGTGTRFTLLFGYVTAALLTVSAVFGLLISPEDVTQGASVRLLYVHVPTVWVAYGSFVFTAVCSALYLFPKKHSLGFDRFAGASAEIGTVFMGLTLISGAMWGKITWGVYWQWDARLTTTALLFVTYIGYLAVRGLDGTQHQRAKRSAIVGLLAAFEVPLVHWSVKLWRSLHQDASVLDSGGDVSMDGLMLFTLMLSLVSFTALFAWLLLHRSRTLALADMLADHGLDAAIVQRQNEGDRPEGGRS